MTLEKRSQVLVYGKYIVSGYLPTWNSKEERVMDLVQTIEDDQEIEIFDESEPEDVEEKEVKSN